MYGTSACVCVCGLFASLLLLLLHFLLLDSLTSTFKLIRELVGLKTLSDHRTRGSVQELAFGESVLCVEPQYKLFQDGGELGNGVKGKGLLWVGKAGAIDRCNLVMVGDYWEVEEFLE